MGFKSKSKFLKFIVPLSLTSFIILFFIKKNNMNYVSVDMEIPVRFGNRKN